jgi:4-hydroxybenzoate polyprenyltransferase
MDSNDQQQDVLAAGNSTVPLVVDLDGTLVRTDLLVEGIAALLKRNFLYIFLLPLWLLKGKANFKRQIASRVELDANLLPYHTELLDFIESEKRRGRSVLLVTASNQKFANAVAEHVGLFDEVLASDAHVNRSGRQKLAWLLEKFGDGGFDYAANGRVDLPIWAHSREAILVNATNGVRQAAERHNRTIRIFEDRDSHQLTRYLKALRLHQWLKNLLIFVPLIMAHRINELDLLAQAVMAFFSFGLCASSVYLLNDLFDLPEDREHPTKHKRPFASGQISMVHGAAMIPVLLISGFAIASLLPIEFVAVLSLYYVLTLAYSLRLKQFAVIDVLTLAVLYTLRVIAGAAAVTVMPSFWLLAFSMFLFLSLALAKRFTELFGLQKQEQTRAAGRDYTTSDLEALSQFGSASAFASVLLLALYINSETVLELYTRPQVIWLLCPLLLFIVMRIWLQARRGELDEDPVIFAISDRYSQILAVIGALLLWLAI